MNSDLRIRVIPAIADVPAAAWDACGNPNSKSQDRVYNPFISHAFLSALEASGSAAARTGWQPQHLIAEAENGAMVGAVPAYLKSHSRGEYVFDWGWAQAYERAGGRYYPKLQCAVPFTPVTGPRLLARTGEAAARAELQHTLLAGMVELAQQRRASSVHVTFPTEPEHDL